MKFFVIFLSMQTLCMDTPTRNIKRTSGTTRSSTISTEQSTPSIGESSTPTVSEKERKRIIEELLKDEELEKIKREKKIRKNKPKTSSSPSKSPTPEEDEAASENKTVSTEEDDTLTNEGIKSAQGNTEEPSYIGSVSSGSVAPINPQNIFETTVDYWNGFWGQDGDGSFVSVIDKSNMQVIIEDPSRDEKLIVKVDKNPYRRPADLQELIYDPRIKQREDEDLAQGKRDHIFARMLDYVIQCAGKFSLFAKDDSDQPKDRIIATVTRVNKTTKREILCKAEYTFYKDKSGKDHLYHRLLRPIQ